MKTPTFNDFEYLHSEIKNELVSGLYQIEISYWDNIKLRNIYSFVSIKQVSRFGGNMNGLAGCCIAVCFSGIVIAMFLRYFNRIKFKDKVTEE